MLFLELISDYFGDLWKDQCLKKCDNCSDKVIHHEIDVTDDIQNICTILSHSMKIEKKLTFPKLIDVWLGKGEKKLRPENLAVCAYSRQIAQQIVGFLLVDNYLKEEFHFTPYSTISYVQVGPAWLLKTGEPIKYWLHINVNSSNKRIVLNILKDTEKGDRVFKRIKSISNDTNYNDMITID